MTSFMSNMSRPPPLSLSIPDFSDQTCSLFMNDCLQNNLLCVTPSPNDSFKRFFTRDSSRGRSPVSVLSMSPAPSPGGDDSAIYATPIITRLNPYANTIRTESGLVKVGTPPRTVATSSIPGPARVLASRVFFADTHLDMRDTYSRAAASSPRCNSTSMEEEETAPAGDQRQAEPREEPLDFLVVFQQGSYQDEDERRTGSTQKKSQKVTQTQVQQVQRTGAHVQDADDDCEDVIMEVQPESSKSTRADACSSPQVGSHLLKALPTKVLSGLGNVKSAQLVAAGIVCLGDLASCQASALVTTIKAGHPEASRERGEWAKSYPLKAQEFMKLHASLTDMALLRLVDSRVINHDLLEAAYHKVVEKIKEGVSKDIAVCEIIALYAPDEARRRVAALEAKTK